MQSPKIKCDGCGQAADAEHIARRLKRLEAMSRYRPIHVQGLFMAASAPSAGEDYLYSAKDSFSGESAVLLGGLGFERAGKPVGTVLAEFQRRGFLLAHLLDCPAEPGQPPFGRTAFEQRLEGTFTRIRKSFKPRRLVLIGPELTEFVEQFTRADLGAALLLNNGKPFEWNEIADGELAKELAAPLQTV
jgi:hypothetical protein